MEESTGILQAALQTSVHIWEPFPHAAVSQLQSGNTQRLAVAVGCWEHTSTTWSSSTRALHPKVPQGKRVHWLEERRKTRLCREL